MATGALDGCVSIWKVSDGSLVQALEGPEEDINWISWHPKGNVIIAGSVDMLVWMWMATTGDCMQVFSGHSGPVTCGSFSPDGKFIVTASSDCTAKVWNPKNGKCRHSEYFTSGLFFSAVVVVIVRLVHKRSAHLKEIELIPVTSFLSFFLGGWYIDG